MDTLVISLVALFTGPLLVPLALRVRWAAGALDSFVLIVIGGFVFLHLLPLSLEAGGPFAWLAAIIGLLAPILAERGLLSGNRNTHRTILIVAGLGLAVHAFLDGMGLKEPNLHSHGGVPCTAHDHSNPLLAWAIILHQIPVSIGIWWILPQAFSKRVALFVLIGHAVFTTLGFAFGSHALAGASQQGMAVFQALLCGSLLHVVLHSDLPAPLTDQRTRWQFPSLVGCAMAVLVLIAISHPGETSGLARTFLNLSLVSAPALLLGYAMVGLFHVAVPMTWLSRATSGTPLSQALRGVAIGLPVPVCSCGVLPIYRDMVARGAGPVAAIAFLLATPELEVAAVLLTVSLMGVEFAIARVIAAVLLAVVVGLYVGKKLKRHEDRPAADSCASDDGAKSKSLIYRALQFGFGDAVHHTGAWILLGIALSALLAPHLHQSWITTLSPHWQVPLAVLLGLPLYVCASGSTPIAAMLMIAGLSPGAVLALLLAGPATNLATFGILSNLHSPKDAFRFGGAVAVGTLALGYGTNALLPRLSVQGASVLMGAGTTLQYVCLIVLGLALLANITKHGTRSFIEQLFQSPLTLTKDPSGHHHHHHGDAVAELEPVGHSHCDH
jgi:uncharacterized membrane protein YraQ (UPF0718 family)